MLPWIQITAIEGWVRPLCRRGLVSPRLILQEKAKEDSSMALVHNEPSMDRCPWTKGMSD